MGWSEMAWSERSLSLQANIAQDTRAASSSETAALRPRALRGVEAVHGARRLLRRGVGPSLTGSARREGLLNVDGF